jgi:hypothetical protein
MAIIYSFKDLSGVFSHPLIGNMQIGSINELNGLGQITITMANDNTIQDIGVDGGIIIWPVAVFNGSVSIQCQQNSDINKYFLSWFNTLKANMINQSSPDVSYWANGAMILRNIHNGTTHHITGISPQKQPDKSYSTQGGTITWNLLAGNIDNNKN